MKLEHLSDETLLDMFARLANHNQMIRYMQPYAGVNAQKYIVVRTELLRRLLSYGAFIKRFCSIMKNAGITPDTSNSFTDAPAVCIPDLGKLYNEGCLLLELLEGKSDDEKINK